MPKLSLSVKTALSNAILLLLILIAGGTAVLFTWQQAATASRINALSELTSRDLPALMLDVKNMQIAIIQVQQFLTDVSATRGQDGLDDGFEEAAKNAKAFAERATSLRALAAKIGADQVVKALDEVETSFGPYYEGGQKMAKVYVAEGPVGGNKMMSDFDARSEKLSGSMEKLIGLSETMSKDGQARIDRETDAALAQLGTLSNLLYVIGGVSLAIAFGVIGYSHFGVSRPLRAMTDCMRALVAGRTDIVIPSLARSDEIGAIGQAVEVFRANAIKVREAETRQRALEATIEESKKQSMLRMAETVEHETGRSVEAVAGAARDVDGVAEGLSTLARGLSAEAQAVAAASEEALANAESVSAGAEEMSASIQAIVAQVDKASAATRTAVAGSARAQETIRSLSDVVAKIADMTNLIGGIAEQTNLLALNATIEAARAGDAGRGFAVVAAEVKSLSNQTARSTEEIGRLIHEIQGATEAAVGAVSDIGRQIGEIDQVAGAVSLAMEQQGAATGEIAQNVSQSALAAQEVSAKIALVSRDAAAVDERAARVRAAIAGVTANITELRSVLVNVVRTSSAEADRRLQPRYRVACGVNVVCSAGNRVDARLSDISRGGARVTNAPDLQIGETGTIEIEGLAQRLPFQVRYREKDALHLEFSFEGPVEAAYLAWFNARIEGLAAA